MKSFIQHLMEDEKKKRLAQRAADVADEIPPTYNIRDPLSKPGVRQAMDQIGAAKYSAAAAAQNPNIDPNIETEMRLASRMQPSDLPADKPVRGASGKQLTFQGMRRELRTGELTQEPRLADWRDRFIAQTSGSKIDDLSHSISELGDYTPEQRARLEKMRSDIGKAADKFKSTLASLDDPSRKGVVKSRKGVVKSVGNLLKHPATGVVGSAVGSGLSGYDIGGALVGDGGEGFLDRPAQTDLAADAATRGAGYEFGPASPYNTSSVGSKAAQYGRNLVTGTVDNLKDAISSSGWANLIPAVPLTKYALSQSMLPFDALRGSEVEYDDTVKTDSPDGLVTRADRERLVSSRTSDVDEVSRRIRNARIRRKNAPEFERRAMGLK